MKFVHTNIAAKDWKRLSQFYITVFDCRVKPPERNYSGDWLDMATGLFRASLEGVHLALPGFKEEGPTLEIFTYDKMEETGEIMATWALPTLPLRWRMCIKSLKSL